MISLRWLFTHIYLLQRVLKFTTRQRNCLMMSESVFFDCHNLLIWVNKKYGTSDRSPLTPVHSLFPSLNPPFSCGGFVASEHEGCASRAASDACCGLSRAGCRVSRWCPFVSGTRRSAVRGGLMVLLPERNRRCYLRIWRGFSTLVIALDLLVFALFKGTRKSHRPRNIRADLVFLWFSEPLWQMVDGECKQESLVAFIFTSYWTHRMLCCAHQFLLWLHKFSL